MVARRMVGSVGEIEAFLVFGVAGGRGRVDEIPNGELQFARLRF